MSASNTAKGESLAEHQRGNLTPAQLDTQITEIWAGALASEAGRRQVAAALGVKPEDLRPEALKKGDRPVSVISPSGLLDPTLLIVGQWVLTTVVVPILVDLTKDEAKKRLTQLWKQVLLPAIRAKSQGAFKD